MGNYLPSLFYGTKIMYKKLIENTFVYQEWNRKITNYGIPALSKFTP